MDEAQKRRKRRAIKMAITELLMMFLAVVMVIVLMFLVMGYKIDEEGQLKQDGFLQVQSWPATATISIDQEQGLALLSSSKTVSAGEHEVSIKKTGYSNWQKKIKVSPGLIYRLEYPKLFLLERKQESLTSLPNLDFVSVAPDRSKMLVVSEGKTKWQAIDLNEEMLTIRELALEKILPELEAQDSAGTIKLVNWNDGSDKLLLTVERGGKTEWVLADIEQVERSKNLTQEFGLEFSKMKMVNKSGEQLLALEGTNLRRLDVSAGEISKVLVKNVEDFNSFGNKIIYVNKKNNKRTIRVYVPEKEKSLTLKELENNQARVLMALSSYYDGTYATVVVDNQLLIYRGKFEDEQEKIERVKRKELSFSPSEVLIKGRGELLIAKNAENYAVFDIEPAEIKEYQWSEQQVWWLDEFRYAYVQDDVMKVVDFDATNKVKLSKDVNGQFAMTITNDSWLYYFDQENNLVRETI